MQIPIISDLPEIIKAVLSVADRDIVITIKNPQVEGVKVGDELTFRICKPLTEKE